MNLAPGGGYASGGVPVTGTLPELGQSRSAGLSPPKWHFAGTWAAHHDPRTISQLMQKRFTFVNVAPAIWRWRWHWCWCCRLQKRLQQGPGGARAQLCELHGRSRPPDCCPGSPWPTQIAQRSRRPSPQPKATSQGSTVQPGRAGHGRPGEEWALRGVCSRFKFALAVPIQTPCNIATSPLPSHATLAGPHALVAQTSRLRPRPPTRPRPSNPRTLRMSSGSMTMG